MSPWGSGQVMAIQVAPRGSGLSSTQASWLCSLPFQGSGLCPSIPPVKLPSHAATHVAVPATAAARWPREKEGGGRTARLATSPAAGLWAAVGLGPWRPPSSLPSLPHKTRSVSPLPATASLPAPPHSPRPPRLQILNYGASSSGNRRHKWVKTRRPEYLLDLWAVGNNRFARRAGAGSCRPRLPLSCAGGPGAPQRGERHPCPQQRRHACATM